MCSILAGKCLITGSLGKIIYIWLYLCVCDREREKECESVSCSFMSDSLQPHRLLCLWDSPSKNTGVGNHSPLQGVFPTQGLNTSPAFQAISLPSKPLEKPLCVCIHIPICVYLYTHIYTHLHLLYTSCIYTLYTYIIILQM